MLFDELCRTCLNNGLYKDHHFSPCYIKKGNPCINYRERKQRVEEENMINFQHCWSEDCVYWKDTVTCLHEQNKCIDAWGRCSTYSVERRKLKRRKEDNKNNDCKCDC